MAAVCWPAPSHAYPCAGRGPSASHADTTGTAAPGARAVAAACPATAATTTGRPPAASAARAWPAAARRAAERGAAAPGLGAAQLRGLPAAQPAGPLVQHFLAGLPKSQVDGVRQLNNVLFRDLSAAAFQRELIAGQWLRRRLPPLRPPGRRCRGASRSH